MSNHTPAITVEFDDDPESCARARAQGQKYERNWDWLEAHAAEVYSHRGKFICIAGQELFVGDDVKEILARAQAAHPDDDGRFTRYIPKEKVPRIYAHRRSLASL